MIAPRFTHDCESCELIGTAEMYGNDCDVYVCPQGGEPTVVLRYGNDGPQYHSGARLGLRLPDDLAAEAHRRMTAFFAEGHR